MFYVLQIEWVICGNVRELEWPFSITRCQTLCVGITRNCEIVWDTETTRSSLCAISFVPDVQYIRLQLVITIFLNRNNLKFNTQAGSLIKTALCLIFSDEKAVHSNYLLYTLRSWGSLSLLPAHYRQLNKCLDHFSRSSRSLQEWMKSYVSCRQEQEKEKEEGIP